MKILRFSTVLGLALVVAACPADDAPPPDEPAAMDEPREDPAAAPASERVNLEEMFNSGITGEAVIMPHNDQTHITLTVEGARPDATLPAHIHQGRCETQGPVVESLQSVSTDQMGRGQSESMVGIPAATLMNGQHFVQAHQGNGDEVGPPVACADLPQRDMPAPGMQPDTPRAQQPGQPGSP